MIHELGPLRMAIDEYDRAEDKHRRAYAQKRIDKLVTVGLLRLLIAAVDDPARPGPAVNEDDVSPS